MAHSDCGWTCGCAGETVRSLENTCHTWALLWWCFTTKRRYIKCMHLYPLPFTFLPFVSTPTYEASSFAPPPPLWRLCRRSGRASDAIAKWERMAIAFAVNGLMIVSGNPGAISRTARLRERANDNASSIWVSLHHTGPRLWRRCGSFRWVHTRRAARAWLVRRAGKT